MERRFSQSAVGKPMDPIIEAVNNGKVSRQYIPSFVFQFPSYIRYRHGMVLPAQGMVEKYGWQASVIIDIQME